MYVCMYVCSVPIHLISLCNGELVFIYRGTPSKYSLIDKVVDGMRIEIRSVLVFLKDPLFHAQLEIMDILIQSTSWEWQVVPLNKSR